MSNTRVIVVFRTEAQERSARVAIESLRTFGGLLSDSTVWAFVLDPDRASNALADVEGVHRFPLVVDRPYRRYPFAAKVDACARAERMAGPETCSLVWLSLDCLFVNPPLLFDLGPADEAGSADAALRPVHHRNIGSLARGPLDDFWQGVYGSLGVDEMPYTVESFADGQMLRPYFNTHCFAFNPTVGLARAWWAHFKALVADDAFQAGPCGDALHRVFLHQAVLSTLVPKMLAWERVRLLPPEYNYPLNLLHEIPPACRPATLNSLISVVYEEAFPWGEIRMEEPLRSWLTARISGGEGA